MRSVLSQITRASFVFRISFSCSRKVKAKERFEKVPFRYVLTIIESLDGAAVRARATLANSKGILPRVKDDGWFGISYQNLSPRREWLNCVAITQAKVGPSMLPGSGLSDTPPDHKSTSAGCLKAMRPGVAVISGDRLFLETQRDRSTDWVMRRESLIDRLFDIPKVSSSYERATLTRK